MKILDWYILKRYLLTFFFTLLILIPIAVAIDVAEKVDKFLRHPNLGLVEILNDYYKNFVIYYANTFMPLAVFIAVIFFTSKLANNTEIVAYGNAKISFTRFLRPYLIGATLVTLLALIMNHFAVPSSSKIRKKFERDYINSKRSKSKDRFLGDFSLQLSDSTYMYLKSFDFKTGSGSYFTTDVYDGINLKYRLSAGTINWIKKDSTFKLFNYTERFISKERDSFVSGNKLDTVFAFTPKDFQYKSALSQEMPTNELTKFIDISKKRGVKNLNAYMVELHKRTSLPIATYVLTIIAVALSHRKRRGGTGLNLAVGIAIMFIYIFFLKVSEVLGAVAGANSFVYVWIPNIVFGALATYLFINARKQA